MEIGRQELISFKESLSFYQKMVFDPMTEFLAKQGLRVLDGKLNQVYATQTEDKVMLLNFNINEAETRMVQKDGTEKKIRGNSIAEIEI